MAPLGRETSNAQYEEGSALRQEHAYDAQRPVPSTAPRRAFRHFGEKTPVREKVVPGGGFEPPTRGFSVRCSTN